MIKRGLDLSKNPEVSVVIPTYKEGKYLRKCLESLERSLKMSYELIIVDSYSDDGTVEIAKSYGARVLYVEKGNVGLARYVGFKESKGRILVSASADNVFPKDYFDLLLSPILDDEADITLGKISVENPSLLSSIGLFVLNDVLIPLFNVFGLVFAVADSMAFKREVFDAISFPKTPTAEDTLFIKRARKEGFRIVQTNAIVYTSDRRLRKWGAWKFFKFHLKNFLKANLYEKFEEEYEPVR